MKKPYLLSPCGSPEALRAAVSAGADECYFGGSAGNARMNAKGFSDQEFLEALKFTRLHGVRSNITLNTLNYDRELPETLRFAKEAWESGADAFIVQDIGLAKILKEHIPDIELHASTQCACHNLDGAKELSKLGFSRIVLARELPLEDIQKITEYGRTVGGFETEVFVHGALCVCHSGMCLMSSVIGKRSGNRGLCAQPCRMAGSLESTSGRTKNNIYPLSLKDLTLSKHITEILPLGISSLKIEGRMKSPEYVYRTTAILRALIDSSENASDQKYAELLDIFSRGGFTDGYFTGKYLSDNRRMYGFRSENDKEKTAGTRVDIPDVPKIPVKLYASIRRGEPICISLDTGEKSTGKVFGKCPEDAVSSPMTKESFLKNISKLGSTPFVLESEHTELDDGLFLPASEINAVRREASEKLEKLLTGSGRERTPDVVYSPPCEKRRTIAAQKLRFFTDDPHFSYDKARYPEELESICLPLGLFADRESLPDIKLPFGVRLPRVIFEAEYAHIEASLENAAKCGAMYIYISNIGHIGLAKSAGLPIYGGMGLNVTNSESFWAYADMGISCITLSPELKCAAMRDIVRKDGVTSAATVQGRLPLMVLESCILRANGLCENACRKGSYCGKYKDRIGKEFPIYPEGRFSGDGTPCRNIILNADILDIYSKKTELEKCGVEILEILSE